MTPYIFLRYDKPKLISININNYYHHPQGRKVRVGLSLIPEEIQWFHSPGGLDEKPTMKHNGSLSF